MSLSRFVILLLLLPSCEFLEYGIPTEPPCLTNTCNIFASTAEGEDANGYLHATISSEGFSYFPIYFEASGIKEKFRYNGVSVISAHFDTDTYWITGDTLVVIIPLYNPFTSLYSNPYWNTPLPVGSRTVYLSQFAKSVVPVVSSYRVYFQHYEANINGGYVSEFLPRDTEKYMWTKKIVGPVPAYMKGDTVTVYTKIYWDAGNSSVKKEMAVKVILD
jgi:hypothetical protein